MALAEDWFLESLIQPGDTLTALDSLIPPKPPWMARAACRGHDQRAFFHSRDQVTDEARVLCADCPVKGPCLAYALGRRR